MRTPLTSLNLDVTLLSDEDLSYERRVQLTREMKRQLERMQWLTESLLKISKIDAGTAIFANDKVYVKELLSKAAEPFLIPMELRDQQPGWKPGRLLFCCLWVLYFIPTCWQDAFLPPMFELYPYWGSGHNSGLNFIPTRSKITRNSTYRDSGGKTGMNPTYWGYPY